MKKIRTIVGQNLLTVLVSKPPEQEKYRRKAFFCPYTGEIVVTYQGTILSIFPGYNPEETPQIAVRPKRVSGDYYDYDINYSFRESAISKDPVVNFWIQDQYLKRQEISMYRCYNCRAPQLYFSSKGVFFCENQKEIEVGQTFNCPNINCETQLRYLGMVKIENVEETFES